MSDPRLKSLRVRFFELRVLPDDVAIGGRRWTELIRRLEGTSNCGKPGAHECEYNGVMVEGLAFIRGGNPHAALAVDRAVTPRQRDRRTARRTDLPIDAHHEPVEETYVSFFPNNVVGLVSSTTSAPSHVAVAAWLNEVAPPTFHEPQALWHATPIIDPDKYQEILNAVEATSVTFAVKPQNIPVSEQGLLGALVDQAMEIGHGVRIEVKVSAGRGRPGEMSRSAVLGLARRLVGLHQEGVDLEKAQASVRRAYGEAVEPIDLLQHRLARVAEIPITDGRSLDEAVVLAESRVAYNSMRDEIAAAIGVS